MKNNNKSKGLLCLVKVSPIWGLLVSGLLMGSVGEAGLLCHPAVENSDIRCVQVNTVMEQEANLPADIHTFPMDAGATTTVYLTSGTQKTTSVAVTYDSAGLLKVSSPARSFLIDLDWQNFDSATNEIDAEIRLFQFDAQGYYKGRMICGSPVDRALKQRCGLQ
jgi:hypothetical protein